MKKFNKNLCFIIPALNEQDSIVKIISKVKVYGKIVVVDDGSEDKTNFLSKKMGAIVVNHKFNKGYEKSLFSGFKKAIKLGNKFAITIDADGQHSIKDVVKIISHLHKNIAIVYASRKKKQRFMEYIYSYYTKFFYNIEDPLCGLKGYNLSFSQSCGILNDDNLIGSRALINSKKKNFLNKEIKIKTKLRKNNKSRYGGVLNGNLKILFATIKLIIIDLNDFFRAK